MAHSATLFPAGTAANGTGPSTSGVDSGGAVAAASVAAVTTGTLTGGTVQLQGSLDGTSWFALGSPLTLPTSAGVAVTSVSLAAGTAGLPCRFLRGVIASFAGTGSVGVTCVFAKG